MFLKFINSLNGKIDDIKKSFITVNYEDGNYTYLLQTKKDNNLYRVQFDFADEKLRYYKSIDNGVTWTYSDRYVLSNELNQTY